MSKRVRTRLARKYRRRALGAVRHRLTAGRTGQVHAKRLRSRR